MERLRPRHHRGLCHYSRPSGGPVSTCAELRAETGGEAFKGQRVLVLLLCTLVVVDSPLILGRLLIWSFRPRSYLLPFELLRPLLPASAANLLIGQAVKWIVSSPGSGPRGLAGIRCDFLIRHWHAYLHGRGTSTTQLRGVGTTDLCDTSSALAYHTMASSSKDATSRSI